MLYKIVGTSWQVLMGGAERSIRCSLNPTDEVVALQYAKEYNQEGSMIGLIF